MTMITNRVARDVEKWPWVDYDERGTGWQHVEMSLEKYSLADQAEFLLHAAQFQDRKKWESIEQRMADNPELQQVICDLLEPVWRHFDQARTILNKNTGCDTHQKHKQALHALGLDTGTSKRLPGDLFWQYASLITEGKKQTEAVDLLVERHMLHGRKSALRELRRQLKVAEGFGFRFENCLPTSFDEILTERKSDCQFYEDCLFDSDNLVCKGCQRYKP